MPRPPRFKEQALAHHDRNWSVDQDVFLIEHQDMPIADQAAHLQLSVDAVAERRQRLGLVRRAMAVQRLQA